MNPTCQAMNNDLDRLSREYASEEFSKDDPVYRKIREAFLAGGAAAGANQIGGYKVFSIEFEFPKKTVKVELRDELIVKRKSKFIKDLMGIFPKANKIKVYGQSNI